MPRLFALLAVCFALSASAQIRVDVNIPLPAVRFEAPPPLVVVEPGIQVVPEHEEEVFVVDNVWYTRRGERWYRSPDHRGGWVECERARVPPRLVAIPAGRYRHWKHEVREERREERREVRHEVREEEHEEHGKGHHKH